MKPVTKLVTTLLLVCLPHANVAAEDAECTSNGFFRNPDDCTRFYRCVDLTGRGYFQKYTFSCPVGTVFDETVSVCNHPWAAPPCDSNKEEEQVDGGDDGDDSMTVIVAPTFDFQCSNKGIFPHDSDCARFWLCKLQDGKPELYKCPAGYLFNDDTRRCVKEEDVTCTKVPDMVRLRTEPKPYVLTVGELDSFFARWATL